MKVPQEWIEEILKFLTNTKLFNNFPWDKSPMDLKKDARQRLDMYLSSYINDEWNFNPTLTDQFKDFFIRVCNNQCHQDVPNLTCGVGGEAHQLLVPRIHISGECYLVCPTCGWIQKQHNVPGFGE